MQPEFASIDQWVKLSGLGRTTTYSLISQGKLRAVKAGRRTLIDVPAGIAWINSLPEAEVRCGRIGRAVQ